MALSLIHILRPTSEHGEVYRDAEYKRLGTLSLLAGIDLLTGEDVYKRQSWNHTNKRPFLSRMLSESLFSFLR